MQISKEDAEDPRSEAMIAYMCKYCNYTREQYLRIVDATEEHNEAGLEIVARILEKDALKKIERQRQAETGSREYMQYIAKKEKSRPKTRR